MYLLYKKTKLPVCGLPKTKITTHVIPAKAGIHDE